MVWLPDGNRIITGSYDKTMVRTSHVEQTCSARSTYGFRALTQWHAFKDVIVLL